MAGGGAPVKKGAKDAGTVVRTKIQASIDLAQEEHRRELLRRRIELARHGVRSYQLRRLGEAVRAFHTYLRILEDWKGVPEGGLNPSVFDIKKDVPELLLISGVYWDLLKLYDRTRSPSKQKEFFHYLEKYIVFSKGMPFQPLAAETLRKYISNEKPVHREDFKNAYKMLTGSSCFVATSLMDVSQEGTLPRLREFRDRVLQRSRSGRKFIAWYYSNGPEIASRVDRLPARVRSILGGTLDVVGAGLSAVTFLFDRGGKPAGCRRSSPRGKAR